MRVLAVEPKGHLVDFEELGRQAVIETQNPEVAWRICSEHIQTYAAGLQPDIAELDSAIHGTKGSRAALCAHLYDRPVPVSDARMLALTVSYCVMAVLAFVVGIASAASHTVTFVWFGLNVPLSVVLGAALTGVALAAGHLAFERILVHHPILQVAVILAGFGLCFWGLFQMAQGRSAMAERVVTKAAPQSFVEDAPPQDALPANASREESSEQSVRKMLGGATVKIMLAADLMVGILLGLVMRTRTDDDHVAWRDLKELTANLLQLEKRRDELVARPEIAKRQCMAGILRAAHARRRNFAPYYLPVLLFGLVLAVVPVRAQSIERHEAILIDMSGSIGKGGANNELFREYLYGVKKLLLSEPDNSRVWVSVISTESFGSVRELIKGWTPSAHGVFTDDLNRARRQLADAFETKSAGLSPIAAGTDIIGALWHAKALLESGFRNGNGMQREIWIFSDMVNETQELLMPSLTALGPEKILERAKTNGLVVPLRGYRIHVLGASPAGLSPQTWNTVRTFWTLYFREAGVDLFSYSPECQVGRN